MGIVVSSDAHISFDIGDYTNALDMLKEISFPEKLIMNSNLTAFEEFMAEKGKKLFSWHVDAAL